MRRSARRSSAASRSSLHAESPGKLAYALDFVRAHPDIVVLGTPHDAARPRRAR
jgi:hypothetical protein